MWTTRISPPTLSARSSRCTRTSACRTAARPPTLCVRCTPRPDAAQAVRRIGTRWPTSGSRLTRSTSDSAAIHVVSRGGRAARIEQHLDGPSATRILDRQDRFMPALEREPVGDDRRQVQAAGDEVEVVQHGVLSDTADFLNPEAVRPDDAEFLEVQGRPLEPLGRLDAGNDKGAAGDWKSTRL